MIPSNFPVRLRLACVLVLSLSIAACDDILPGESAAAPVGATEVPAGTQAVAPVPSPNPAPAAAPTPAGLTRDGQQVVMLDIRNLTDEVIVSLTAVRDAGAPVTLLRPGTGIPAGGTYPVAAAPGQYLLRAEMQAPNLFSRGRQIQRTVIVPRFPPNPPPRMQVTLR